MPPMSLHCTYPTSAFSVVEGTLVGYDQWHPRGAWTVQTADRLGLMSWSWDLKSPAFRRPFQYAEVNVASPGS